MPDSTAPDSTAPDSTAPDAQAPEKVPAGLRGVLFDIDGTLVDTTFVHTLCWWQAMRENELDAPMAEIHRAVGMGSDKLVEHVLGSDVDVEVAALTASHDALYASYWSRLRPLPGAVELIRRCHAAGLTTVLASSASERELSVLLKILDCDEAIDETTCSDDAESSKPDPDIVAVALKKAGLHPGESLFLGDAVWDVEASGKLEVACIGLESGGTSAAELLRAGALATYKHPQDLLQHEQEWLS